MTRDGKHRLGSYARENGAVRALLGIPGVGLLTVTALVAAVGSAQHFAMADTWRLGWASHQGAFASCCPQAFVARATFPTGEGKSVTGR